MLECRIIQGIAVVYKIGCTLVFWSVFKTKWSAVSSNDYLKKYLNIDTYYNELFLKLLFVQRFKSKSLAFPFVIMIVGHHTDVSKYGYILLFKFI